MRPAWLLGACLMLGGCRPAGPPAAVVKLAHRPPTAKDVIDAVMLSSRTPLADSTCRAAGTEAGDNTIGRYLAGYLAELSAADGGNAVTTSVETRTEDGQPVFVCRLMVRHAQGEDVWSWGVEFKARQSDGVLQSGSFRCLGAG